MEQQPLKSFDHPLMRASLSNAILLLSENKPIICAIEKLHYPISRENLEPELELRPPDFQTYFPMINHFVPFQLSHLLILLAKANLLSFLSMFCYPVCLS